MMSVPNVSLQGQNDNHLTGKGSFQSLSKPSKYLFSEQTAAIKQSSLMNMLFTHSLKLQFDELRAFHRFGKGEVVILVGTSTAGKSSMIEAYKHYHPDVVEEGIDKKSLEMMIQQVREQYPEELRLLEEALVHSKNNIAIVDAIFGPKTIPLRYKEGISSTTRLKADFAVNKISEGVRIDTSQVESMMLEDVFNLSSKGKLTIFDVLEIEGIFQQCVSKHLHFPMRVVLVYCPFQILSQRMEARNLKANDPKNPMPSEVRLGTFPLFQYAKLFGPKQNDHDLVLETLHRDTVVAIFKKNFQDEIANERSVPRKFVEWINTLKGIHGSNLSEEEVLQREEVSYMNNFLHQLGFTSEEVSSVEIVPREQNYHYLLDSSQLTAQQSAEILHHDTRTLHLI